MLARSSRGQFLRHMVCFSSFFILCKSVFEPMYLAGSEGCESKLTRFCGPVNDSEKIGYLVEKNMNWYMVLSILIPSDAKEIIHVFLHPGSSNHN